MDLWRCAYTASDWASDFWRDPGGRILGIGFLGRIKGGSTMSKFADPVLFQSRHYKWLAKFASEYLSDAQRRILTAELKHTNPRFKAAIFRAAMKDASEI